MNQQFRDVLKVVTSQMCSWFYHETSGPVSTWVPLPLVTLINFLLLLNIAEDNLSKSPPLLSPSEVSGGSGGVGGIIDRNGKLS